MYPDQHLLQSWHILCLMMLRSEVGLMHRFHLAYSFYIVYDALDVCTIWQQLSGTGAPVVLQDTISFLLSSEARQLRPLLVKELVTGLDHYTRDRLQRAYNSLPSLAPRIPFLGPLPLPPLPSPPVYVPGLGFQPVEQLLQKLAPPLSQTEEVYLQSLLEVTSGLLGVSLDG